MKFSRNTLLQLVILVAITALYRVIPNRPLGFAPQLAVALFSGAIFSKDKGIAFLLPLLSMLISDALYQVLYANGVTTIPGFYKGQWINYVLFVSVTIIGFAINSKRIASIIGGIIAAPTMYFLLSNSAVWLGNGGFKRGKTVAGYFQTLTDGIPFYLGSVAGTAFFAGVLFLSYNLMYKKQTSIA